MNKIIHKALFNSVFGKNLNGLKQVIDTIEYDVDSILTQKYTE